MTPLDMFTITCAALGIVFGLIALFLWLEEKRDARPFTREEFASGRALLYEQAAYLKQRILTDADLRSCMCQEDEARLVYDDTIDLDPWEIAAMYSRIAKEKRARGL